VLLAGCQPGTIGSAESSKPGGGRPPPVDLGPIDPGTKVPHRLNNREYDRTLADLLGVAIRPGRDFLDQEDLGFDTIAESFSLTTAQIEAYLIAAESAVDEVWSKPELKARIVVCADESEACIGEIIDHFGSRAWRRPLTQEEHADLVALFGEARTLGETTDGAVAHVLKTMLVSPSFLYRIELDPDPESPTARALSPFELASRLSYFLWSTMPDETLLTLAASGDLDDPAVLSAEVARMLASPKADALVEGFSRQWLGSKRLVSHDVLPETFAGWDEGLKSAMIAESDAYFAEFLRSERPVVEFLQADLHFVDARLAAHYGMDNPGAGVTRITTGMPDRRGYLGLAGFLTMTSFAHRTSPTLRAKHVLGTFLCFDPPPPPPNVVVTDLDQGPDPASIANVRERLEQHRRDPQCAGCHKVMDPFGLGLEAFDPVGVHRTHYSNGDAIDTTGELPDGRRFSGLLELADIVTQDRRFVPCVAEKLYTYGIGRRLDSEDRRALKVIDGHWNQPGKGRLADLVAAIVTSPSFTTRRGSIR
jgi:hypothetical protein